MLKISFIKPGDIKLHKLFDIQRKILLLSLAYNGSLIIWQVLILSTNKLTYVYENDIYDII